MGDSNHVIYEVIHEVQCLKNKGTFNSKARNYRTGGVLFYFYK